MPLFSSDFAKKMETESRCLRSNLSVVRDSMFLIVSTTQRNNEFDHFLNALPKKLIQLCNKLKTHKRGGGGMDLERDQRCQGDDSGRQEYDSSRRFSRSTNDDSYQYRRDSERSFSSWSNDSFSDGNSSRRNYGSSFVSNPNRSSFQSDERSSPHRVSNRHLVKQKKTLSRKMMIFRVFLFTSGFFICGVIIYRRYIANKLIDAGKDPSKSSNSPKPSPEAPTGRPSMTSWPSAKPSAQVKESPTTSNKPSLVPTSKKPNVIPSIAPSTYTYLPSAKPSAQVKESPTTSNKPSLVPTSKKPNVIPSIAPSTYTYLPSAKPSAQVKESPTTSNKPSLVPTSKKPNVISSSAPSTYTYLPSAKPSANSSAHESDSPTMSSKPSSVLVHSEEPSAIPSNVPSSTSKPSTIPSAQVSESPTLSDEPSSMPSEKPSILPSSSPSQGPFEILITEIADPYGSAQHYPFIELYSPNRKNYIIEEVRIDNISILGPQSIIY